MVGSVYNKVLSSLKDCRKSVDSARLSTLCVCIDEAIAKMGQPIQVAVIGKISSSKSTLVNALLGQAEVVRTGQMEETYNVSWIKYGDSWADITVYFKDGTMTKVSRSEWEKWTSHQETNRLKDQVNYIEVTYQHEILKRINIIDTPGLDALSEIDSKNTIAFLKNVHPDAVVMLFTKSIAESTMAVLNDFLSVNKESTFTLNPLNAIGVLAKADMMWSAVNPNIDVLDEGRRVVNRTLYDKYPEVRRSLFDIYPLSALMGLAAASFTRSDANLLYQLSQTDNSTLHEMMSSPEFFMDEDYQVGLSNKEREDLWLKYGQYGLHVLISQIKKVPNSSVQELSKLLAERSGFAQFRRMIVSHFGDRATLIKAQSSLTAIQKACQQERVKGGLTTQDVAIIDEVQKKLLTTFLSIHEYQEWSCLSDIYNGKDVHNQDIVEEFLTVCGERGSAAFEKLSLQPSASIECMVNKATERALYWQRRYNVSSMACPSDAVLIKVMLMSYNALVKELKEREVKMQEAKAILSDCMHYIYGSESERRGCV